jgi:hypothetical protein
MSLTEIQASESGALVRTSFEESEAARSPRIVVAGTAREQAFDIEILARAPSAVLGGREASEVPWVLSRHDGLPKR